MTLEQKLRNGVDKYEDLIGSSMELSDNSIITVIGDTDGVLEVTVDTKRDKETDAIIWHLNGDKLFLTHEEAFQAEL